MPIRFVYLKRMAEETRSVSSSGSDESLKGVMREFREQMDDIYKASKQIGNQVTDLYARAKEETIDWLNEPLTPKPHLREWLRGRGLAEQISINDFLDACYNSAKRMDLESRVVTFHQKDAAALWNGQRRLTVFDISGLLPTLFE